LEECKACITKSEMNMEISGNKKDNFLSLTIAPPNKAIAICGAKFPGCGKTRYNVQAANSPKLTQIKFLFPFMLRLVSGDKNNQ
jgi:hypothetical protein